MASNGITFDEIRTSIVNYFKRQEVFKDYDFTSTATSILIDALAYLGHYVSVYTNFAVNESFLDTAIRRSSVVSLAKNVGYVPKQYTSATAKIRVTYTGTDADFTDSVIPYGTTFVSTYNNASYYFTTLENSPMEYDESDEKYYADLEIIEGTFMSQTWDGTASRFILSHPQVDTEYMNVVVYDNDTDTVGTDFTLLEDANQLTESFISSKFNLAATKKAPLYLISETTQGFVELLFGDDVLSRKIESDNIVKVAFLASHGSDANGLSNFTLNNTSLLGYPLMYWNVETTEVSSGGGDREDIEKIRSNAPYHFQRQGRNVVAEDYKSDILKKYGTVIDAINVWGGEDNDPPSFGTVFACIKPKNAVSFSTEKKKEISSYLKESSVIGITLEVIDPDLIYVDMDTTVTFDKINSNNSVSTIKSQSESVIASYFDGISNTFNAKFVLSKFLTSVYSIDSMITDVSSNITLSKLMLPVRNQEYEYTVDFQNKIEAGTLSTGNFYQSSYDGNLYKIVDDGDGNVNILINSVYDSTIGSVDYETGVVSFTYTFGTPIAQKLTFTVQPYYGNMKSTGNNLLILNSNTVTVETV